MNQEIANNAIMALRLLINASTSISGPAPEHARKLLEGLTLPDGWVDAVLAGWQKAASRKRLKRAYVKALTGSPIRYLNPTMIPHIDLTAQTVKPISEQKKRKTKPRVCRLCGLEPERGRRTWHAVCWNTLEPQTQGYWNKLRRIVAERDNWKCKSCGINLNVRKYDKKSLKAWRSENKVRGSIFQIDHIVPISRGGKHDASNLQLLCYPCHRNKTNLEAMTSLEVRNTDA